MQDTEVPNPSKIKAKPIGGWLWVIAVILIATILSVLINLISTLTEFLKDNLNRYFGSTDEVLTYRINIYIFLLISMLGSLVLLIWATINFFNRTKRFISIFLGFIGYSILTEIIRLLLLEDYAGLTGQNTSLLDSGIGKTIIIGAIAGMYLNKGKRPQQTFIH